MQNTAFPAPDVSAPVILHYTEQDPEIQIGIAIGSEAQEGEVAIKPTPLSKLPFSKSVGSEEERVESPAESGGGRSLIHSPARKIQSPGSPPDQNPVVFFPTPVRTTSRISTTPKILARTKRLK